MSEPNVGGFTRKDAEAIFIPMGVSDRVDFVFSGAMIY
jgi:hypothetical protein